MSSVLSCRGLSVSFGGVHAVRDVDLDVPAGQMVGLIGPNGAGKTTTIDALTGFVASRGTVRLEDRDLSSMSPDRRARAGVARTWQSIELFDDLTVEQNIAVAAHRPSPWRAMREIFSPPRSDSEAKDRLHRLGLGDVGSQMPDQLSQGERKLVGVARALAQDPRVLCLDEPAAGLDVAESMEFGRRLRQLVDEGLSMLLVEHDMGLVLSVCDYVVVLEFGAVIARGTPNEVFRDPRVMTAYLGSGAEQLVRNAEIETNAS